MLTNLYFLTWHVICSYVPAKCINFLSEWLPVTLEVLILKECPLPEWRNMFELSSRIPASR